MRIFRCFCWFLGLKKLFQNVIPNENHYKTGSGAFANNVYGYTYEAVHKIKGENTTITKVENSGITEIELNRGKESGFLFFFNKIKSEELKPQFIAYKLAIKETKTSNGMKVSYILNKKMSCVRLKLFLM